MIAIVDYDVGNLFSLQSSLESIGAEVVLTSDKQTIEAADKIILPGVGAFGDAMQKLHDTGLDSLLQKEAANKKPIMGICLGMQLLFQTSYEYGKHKGLGLLQGEVVSMKDSIPDQLKIPHIGWNALHITRQSELLKTVENGDHVYFVHSFYAQNCDESLIATTEYGKELTAAVQLENVMGCQFHPEKSGDVGLGILKSFCEGKF